MITITIIGDNPVYVVLGTNYIDLGVTAESDEGDISEHDIHVSGDIVNSSVLSSERPSPHTDLPYEVIYTVTDSLGNTETATRFVYVVESEDTSNEDDSDSNNGEQSTQPMEENIMSKFTFDGDFKGTKTHEMEESLPAILQAQRDNLEGSSALSGAQLTAEVAKYVAAGLYEPAENEDEGVSIAAIVALIDAELDLLSDDGQPILIGDSSMSLDSTGRGSLSFDGCKIKTFLHAIQTKGMQICGDLKMDGGEIYLQDGTAASSLIKEVELVHGTLAGDGTFTPTDPTARGITDTNAGDADFIEPIGEGDAPVSDPDGDLDGDSTYGAQNLEAAATPAVQGAGKWYLRLLRPGNTVEYKAFDGLNNLLDGVGATGEVLSILDAMKEVASLQDAIREVVALEKIASITDVDALETKMDADIASLVRWVAHIEGDLKQHITDGDTDVVNYISARLDEVEDSFNDIHDDARLHGKVSGLLFGDCGTEAEFTSADFSSHGEISQWLISVGIEDASNVRRNDLETAWEAEMIDVASVTFSIPADSDFVGAADADLQVMDADNPLKVQSFEFTAGESVSDPGTCIVKIDATLAQSLVMSDFSLQLKGDSGYANIDGAVATAAEAAGKRLKVKASMEQCPAELADGEDAPQFSMGVNAVYCGTQDDVTHSDEAFVSRSYDLNELNLNTGEAADSDTPGTKVAAGQYAN